MVPGNPVAAPRPPILVVDDNPVDQRVVLRMLQRLGVACDVVQDGGEAVAAARRRSYDFVLMDIEMPVADGLSATRAIRAALGPHTPYIVAVTAHGQPADRRRCAEAGVDDVIVKPVRIAALARLLRVPGTWAA
jgi:CheY-like chemotaxis protein